MPLFYFINPCVLQKCLDVPMWRFLKGRSEMKEGDFSPRHTDNSDAVSDDQSQASDKFHCTIATTDTKRSVFGMKVTYRYQ
jgi:hypothetical protein